MSRDEIHTPLRERAKYLFQEWLRNRTMFTSPVFQRWRKSLGFPLAWDIQKVFEGFKRTGRIVNIYGSRGTAVVYKSVMTE